MERKQELDGNETGFVYSTLFMWIRSSAPSFLDQTYFLCGVRRLKSNVVHASRLCARLYKHFLYVRHRPVARRYLVGLDEIAVEYWLGLLLIVN
jgi:hypothetical protein